MHRSRRCGVRWGASQRSACCSRSQGGVGCWRSPDSVPDASPRTAAVGRVMKKSGVRGGVLVYKGPQPVLNLDISGVNTCVSRFCVTSLSEGRRRRPDAPNMIVEERKHGTMDV